MSLDRDLHDFENDFVSIEVEHKKYWNQLEMYIGNVITPTEHHPKHSTIAFEFFEQIQCFKARYIAYKPKSCYHK